MADDSRRSSDDDTEARRNAPTRRVSRGQATSGDEISSAKVPARPLSLGNFDQAEMFEEIETFDQTEPLDRARALERIKERSRLRSPSESARTADAELPTLAKFASRMDTEGEIGRGGMGRVYRIFDRALRRRCAMKILAPELGEDATASLQFIEEAQITGQLDHPNIVPVHALGVLDTGALCFTMKLVNGETLTRKLLPLRNELRRPDWIADYLEIFVKVCDALAFAHHHGVIHCDLKPDNVIVGDYGQVYLMDWGGARTVREGGVQLYGGGHHGESPADGFVVGTLSFMSPESARGEVAQLDERTDIFSLGALLYFVLSGRSPYEGLEEEQEFLAVCRADVVPLSSLPTSAGISSKLSGIVMRALAREPSERYQTVADLKIDLLQYMRGAPDLPVRTYKKGEHIVREGESSSTAYVIRAGTCEAYKVVDGQKLVLRTMGPNEVFGELGILSSKPRTASVVALEDVSVDLVDATTLRDGVGLHTWLGPFVSALVDRFRDVDNRLSLLEHEKRTLRPPDE
jgi:serine/threonine protein kinase